MSILRTSTSALRSGWYSESRKRTLCDTTTVISGKRRRSAEAHRGQVHGNWHQGQGRDHRHGLLEVRRALGLRHRAPADRGVPGSAAGRGNREAARSARRGTARRSIVSTSGNSGDPAATALRLEGIPVTRVENMCATGTEALRGAAYAVAAGAVDIALAIGAEKLKDTGLRRPAGTDKGHAQRPDHAVQLGAGRLSHSSPRGYRAKYGVSKRRPQARDRARLAGRAIRTERRIPRRTCRKKSTSTRSSTRRSSPTRSGCSTAVESATARRARSSRRLTSRAGSASATSSPSRRLQLSLSAGREVSTSDWDGSYVRNTRIAAKKAYEEAGIRNPRKELSMMEVHDCFSITELVTMEDLGRLRGRRSGQGRAWTGSSTPTADCRARSTAG